MSSSRAPSSLTPRAPMSWIFMDVTSWTRRSGSSWSTYRVGSGERERGERREEREGLMEGFGKIVGEKVNV